jgi:hypothetical protein
MIKAKNRLYTNWFIFVLAIPLINAIATLTVGYFPPGALHPGTVSAFFIGIFFIYFISYSYPINKATIVILLLVIYLFFLTIISSNPSRSIYVYLRFFIASIMFPIGYYYVNTYTRLKAFWMTLLWVLVLFVISIAFFNLFKIGSSDYLEGSFYFGEFGVNITKNMVVLLMTAPVFFLIVEKKIWRFTAIFLFSAALIITILGVKRSALLAIIGGILSYAIFSPRKGRTFKLGLIALLILFLASPYFIDTFWERFDARKENVSMTVGELDEDEGRVHEINVTVDRFKNAHFTEKLFGKDVFLYRDFFGTGRLRMTHIDYMAMLDGAGLIGLFLFLFSYIAIYVNSRRFYLLTSKSLLAQELYATMITLIVVQAILSIGGTITGIDLRGIILMILGAIMGTLKGLAIETYNSKNEIPR